MKYYYDLYLSEKYETSKEDFLDNLKRNSFPIDQYLVVLLKSEKNQLEIFNSVLLKQEYFNRDELLVVGIARGLDDAYTIVEKISQEVYNVTGDADIKSYLWDKQKEYEEGNR